MEGHHSLCRDISPAGCIQGDEPFARALTGCTTGRAHEVGNSPSPYLSQALANCKRKHLQHQAWGTGLVMVPWGGGSLAALAAERTKRKRASLCRHGRHIHRRPTRQRRLLNKVFQQHL